MKKIFYFHIGNHKTGTTSIQLFLHNNRDLLKKNNLIYPEIDVSEMYNYNNNNVSWELSNDKRFDKKKRTLSDLIKLIDSAESNIIFSSEDFPIVEYDNKKFQLLKNKITENNFSIKIIIYLRNQIDHFRGMYQICLMLGIPFTSPNKLLALLENSDIIKINKLQFWFDYNKQIQQITKIFDIQTKDIICKSFHQEKNNLISGFYKIIYNSSELDLGALDKKKFNTSLSQLQIKLLECFNKISESESFSIEEKKTIKEFFAFSNNLKVGNNHYLTNHYNQMLRNRFSSSNSLVENNFNIQINKSWKNSDYT
tara:strand:- start:43 stop:975 length:933 start_codon:yes stop_codon:yes gene_type:complete